METKDELQKKTVPDEKVSGLGFRHLQALFLFLALTVLFGMRVNITIAIVEMTDSSTLNYFDWDTTTQSYILSSFTWGYFFLQIPAGLITARFGGKFGVLVAMTINCIVAGLQPLAATYGGWLAVCGCRVLAGLSQGFLFPSMHTLISKWIPLEEKSCIGTLIYTGVHFGTGIQYLVSGYIAAYWGWASIFYFNVICAVVWIAFYAIFGSSSPRDSKFISERERNFIETSLGQTGQPKKYSTPWKSLLTSMPFYALIIVHMGQTWGFWTLLTEMPTYFSSVMNVDIKTNGVLSAIPYFAIVLLGFIFGFVSNTLIEKKILSVTATRKISNTIGHWGPAIALIGLSYSPVGNLMLAVLLLTISVALNAGHYTGFLLVHIDMSPNFGGIMMGITNCAANFCSILAPIVAGMLLEDETSASDWRKVFVLSTFIYFIGNLIYIIFGTSELQTWNEPKEIKCSDEAIEKEESPKNNNNEIGL